MDRVLAIAGLRFRLLSRRVQGAGGAMNVVGAVLLAGAGIVFSAGAALGFGWMIHAFVAEGEADKIRIGFLVVFWTALFVGVFLPLLRGAIDQGFDASPFVGFPVSRRALFGMTVAASAAGPDHLLYYPSLLAVFVTGALLPGTRPLTGLALIVLLAATLVVWSNLLTLILVGVMRARRVREIIVIGGLLLLITVSFLPAMLENADEDVTGRLPQLRSALDATMRAAAVLPPSLAAEGMVRLHDGRGAASPLLWLSIWVVGGLFSGFLVFDRFHLGEPRVKTRTTESARSPARALEGILSFDTWPLRALPSEVRAIASKELRYLLRSVVGRFVLLMGPLFVFFIVLALRRALTEVPFGLDPERLLLFGMMFYAVLFSNNFVYNAFAWEGDGAKAYFLTPISPSRVLLAKNIGLWLYNLILLGLILVAWMIVAGPPGPVTLLVALLLYGVALAAFTAVGNVLSVRFPVPRDISTARNQPSQISIVVSIVVLIATGLVLAPVLTVPALFGWDALQPLLLTVMFAAAAGGYRWALRYAGRLLGHRREALMEQLRAGR